MKAEITVTVSDMIDRPGEQPQPVSKQATLQLTLPVAADEFRDAVTAVLTRQVDSVVANLVTELTSQLLPAPASAAEPDAHEPEP